MAYLVVYHRDQEVGRRNLEGRVVIGRSPECEISVRDILLSRRHCQIDLDGAEWTVTDLASKNGTWLGSEQVTRGALKDGAVVRLGKTTVRFHAGAFVPGSPRAPAGPRRPADPFEALAGTVVGMVVPDLETPTTSADTSRFPTPRPGPREPAGYGEAAVRSLVSELVSSSWDSIHETASRGRAAQAETEPVRRVRLVRPRDPHVALSLQLHAEPEPLVESAPPPAPSRLPLPPAPRRHPRWRWPSLFRRLAMIFQWLGVIMLVVSR